MAYTQGPGIDAPLAVRARTERVDVAADIIPLANWRGLYDAGVFPDGSTVRDGLNLKLVEWAGRNYRAFFDRIPDPANPEPVWLGSLMSHKRDASGQLYMRNRYLDPTSGRFSQEDPIGMAGGLNLYGFGGGDPVNFSDPYGLSPQDTYVGCRPVDGTGGAGLHCAVRVVNEKLGVDLTYELLADGPGKPKRAGQASADQVARYEGNWEKVGVPTGMTSDEFDLEVLTNAEEISAEQDGRPYFFTGGTNSNRFVYRIITESGGKVPSAALSHFPGALAPGLCGGYGLSDGQNCDNRHFRP